MPRGPSNPDRRRQIAKLRAAGLSYRKIGQRLGISRQCVHQMFTRTDPVGLTSIECCACGRKIMRWQGTRPRLVFCLSCLPADATLGQRLRAYRVASKLSQTELARRIGVGSATIYHWEQDGRRPGPASMPKLAGLFSAIPKEA